MNAKRAMMDYVKLHFKTEHFAIAKPFTFIELSFRHGADVYYGCGFSKQNPIDTWDRDRGYLIAEGRAVKEIALKLLARGYRILKDGQDLEYDTDELDTTATEGSDYKFYYIAEGLSAPYRVADGLPGAYRVVKGMPDYVSS